MSSGRGERTIRRQGLQPLPETMQLGARVYQAVVNGIVSGQFGFGAPLRPDAIARELDVSTTPVREAMHRLESEGLAVKLPYQGWFVREFTKQQIQDLYEFRAALERMSVRLACQRITDDEVNWLREHQATGEAALAAKDMNAYRIYNRDLHSAVLRAANNSYLTSAMGQLSLQNEMLMVKTIQIVGRPLRAIEEHAKLIDLIAKRDCQAAEALMEHHIMSALTDVVRWGIEAGNETEPVRTQRAGR